MDELLNLLVINPNSSQSVTDAVRSQLETHNLAANCEFFTGPASSPPSIDDEETALQSTRACLPMLLPRLSNFSAFLVACYSDHPLVEELRKHTNAPVTGILEASIVQALLVTPPNGKFGIVTTGKQWEHLLSRAVLKFIGLPLDPANDNGPVCTSSKFAGVGTSGLGVLELHSRDAGEVKAILGSVARELVEKRGAGIICLGCAGMSGMKEAILSGVEGPGVPIRVVDGVLAGVAFLNSLLAQG